MQQDDPVSVLKSQGYVFRFVSGPSHYNVIISGLEPSVGEDHLRDTFKGCENIFLLQTSDGKARGEALMKFTNEERIEEALRFSGNIQGKEVRLERIKEQETKVQVYNIDSHVQHVQLLKIFGHCGMISGAHQRSNAHAFIVFQTVEGAEKALRLNGLVLGDMPIRVFRTYQDGSTGGGLCRAHPEENLRNHFKQEGSLFEKVPESLAYEIIIKNLGPSVTEAQIRSAYPASKAALLLRSRNGESRGTALLKFETVEGVQDALGFAKVIKNQVIMCEPTGNLLSQILVYNLFNKITEEQLEDIFISCGEIQTIVHRAENGHSFVNFQSSQDAEKALKLNGLIIEGLPISICIPGKSRVASAAVAGVAFGHPNFGRKEHTRLKYKSEGCKTRLAKVTPSPSFEVVLKGIAPNFTEPAINNLFGCKDSFVLRNESNVSRGVALLKFADEEGLRKALDESKKRNDVRLEALGSSRCRVLVYNLSDQVSSERLAVIFTPYAPIKHVEAKIMDGYGFVEFFSEEDAETVLQLDGLVVEKLPLRLCIPDKSQNTQKALELFETPILGGGPRKSASKTKAQSTLEGLFASKKFADLTFEVEGEEILAHKYVVSESSKYFSDLLSAEESSEPKMTKITISDTNSATFKALLEYMYCEEVKPDEDLTIELLKLSDKYAMPSLKQKCEDTLASLLTAENFAKLAKVAEENQTAGLRESLLDFVCKNGIGMIKKDQMDEIPKTLLVDMVQKLSRK